ncbi:hypothetical protein wCauATS_10460 [Wolbachia pipientis]
MNSNGTSADLAYVNSNKRGSKNETVHTVEHSPMARYHISTIFNTVSSFNKRLSEIAKLR